MKFWIVTPSFNQVEWLKRCVASVADQGGAAVEVHHHVQDACSTDGTRDFLAEHLANSCSLKAKGYTFSFESAKDEGMYDAINKGWAKASAAFDIIAYLNCDEQYLPNALKKVAGTFLEHKRAEVLLADFVIVDVNADYVCHKRSVHPVPWIAKLRSAGSPCTTFLRASTFRSNQLQFDTTWKIVGDAVWFRKMVATRVRFHVLHEFTTVFADLSGNLSESDSAKKEKKRYLTDSFLGRWALISKSAYRIQALRRIIIDKALEQPSWIAIYWDSKTRTPVNIQNPTCLWRR